MCLELLFVSGFWLDLMVAFVGHLILLQKRI